MKLTNRMAESSFYALWLFVLKFFVGVSQVSPIIPSYFVLEMSSRGYKQMGVTVEQ